MASLIQSKTDETRVVCIDVNNTGLPRLIGVANEFNIADFQIRSLRSAHSFSSFNVRFTIKQDKYDLLVTAIKKHMHLTEAKIS